jgi:osmotically-inducible protein OsmY
MTSVESPVRQAAAAPRTGVDLLTVLEALRGCARLDLDDIDVTIVPGGVGLPGRVPDVFARNAAVRAVLRVQGVGGVADCLEVVRRP